MEIHEIRWGPAAVTIAFSEEDALRAVAGLPVMMTHQLMIDKDHPQYSDIQTIYETAQDLVRDIVHEWRTAEPFEEPDETEPEDDDDDDA